MTDYPTPSKFHFEYEDKLVYRQLAARTHYSLLRSSLRTDSHITLSETFIDGKDQEEMRSKSFDAYIPESEMRVFSKVIATEIQEYITAFPTFATSLKEEDYKVMERQIFDTYFQMLSRPFPREAPFDRPFTQVTKFSTYLWMDKKKIYKGLYNHVVSLDTCFKLYFIPQDGTAFQVSLGNTLNSAFHFNGVTPNIPFLYRVI